MNANSDYAQYLRECIRQWQRELTDRRKPLADGHVDHNAQGRRSELCAKIDRAQYELGLVESGQRVIHYATEPPANAKQRNTGHQCP